MCNRCRSISAVILQVNPTNTQGACHESTVQGIRHHLLHIKDGSTSLRVSDGQTSCIYNQFFSAPPPLQWVSPHGSPRQFSSIQVEVTLTQSLQDFNSVTQEQSIASLPPTVPCDESRGMDLSCLSYTVFTSSEAVGTLFGPFGTVAFWDDTMTRIILHVEKSTRKNHQRSWIHLLIESTESMHHVPNCPIS